MGVVLVMKGGPDVGKRITFPGDAAVVIGGSPGADLVILDDPMMEVRHCAIEPLEPAGHSLRDLSSEQGTFLNGKRVKTGALRSGDMVRAGLTLIQVLLSAKESTEAQAGGAPDVERPTGVTRRASHEGRPTATPASASLPATEEAILGGLHDSLPSATAQAGYQLREEIGRGRFGRVYEAVSQTTGDRVAIKGVECVSGVSPLSIAAVRREMLVHQALAHPHIVRFIDSPGTDERLVWWVMEYVDGCNLRELVRKSGDGLGIADSCTLVLQLLSALEYAHALPPPRGPLVHRDVKPSNVLVTGTPGGYQAKLVDFGLAKNFETAGVSGLTVTGETRGTLEFMPPEQLSDSKYAGPAADLFAVGGVFYFCLSGKSMYDFSDDMRPSERIQAILDGKTVDISLRWPGVPDQISAIIARAIHKDATERFQSAREMIRAIEETTGAGDAPVAAEQELRDSHGRVTPRSRSGKRQGLTLPEHARGEEIGSAEFPPTAWTLIKEAKLASPEGRTDLLGLLLPRYWKPLYVLFRALNKSHHEAEDLAQGYLCKFLQDDSILSVDEPKGRFRDFLAACAKNFMRSEDRKFLARRRHPSGGHKVISFAQLEALDGKPYEPAIDQDPDDAFRDAWKRGLIERALNATEEECTKRGRDKDFAVFRAYHVATETENLTWNEIARRYDVPSGKKATYMRDWVKQRFIQALRKEVGRYMCSEDEIDGEIMDLLR